ncbi:type II secretion system protein GspM [Oceanisphaera sp. IT1-181]|uniref:type II secretion system protein GspM n=1 Tax=Oceanisphaera sp. IT1-181 TaxID=3081199 RepID=UPI0029CA08B3|nr:type II secretion system protein GspM [Oceanisphaera sp. IT1-181]
MILSDQQQKITAVVLLVAALLLVVGLLIAPLLQLFIHQRQTLTQLESQLLHYRRIYDELPQTKLQIQSLQQQNPDSALYVPETSFSLASAWLQQYISTLVGRHDIQLVSIQNQQLNEQTPLLGIVLGVHLKGQLAQLVPLFHQVESSKPILFIDDLVITANARPNRPSRRRQNPRLPQQAALDIRFNLIGYSIGEQP